MFLEVWLLLLYEVQSSVVNVAHSDTLLYVREDTVVESEKKLVVVLLLLGREGEVGLRAVRGREGGGGVKREGE